MKTPLNTLFSRLPSALPTLAALVLLSAVAPPTASAQNAPQPGGQPHRLSAKTLSQIAALEAEADARTPTEQKISSQLLFAQKMVRGQMIAPGIAQQRTTVALDGAGFTLVDIDGAVTPALSAAIMRVGGQVIGSSVRFGQMRVRVPLSAVTTLAALPDVRFIKPAVKSQLQNPSPLMHSTGPARRKAEVKAHLPVLLAQIKSQKIKSETGISFAAAATNAVGSVTDEGDKPHQADKARSTYNINGTGIKVGVLSDSIDNGQGAYNAAVSSGDVSAVTVISGQAGPSNGEGEGLAMLEVVHHLAPGAQLYFATGDNGQAQFADNIIALQKAGCKVIIDDIAYTDESPFQDDVIAQAINTVTASGAMYFSCAANYGNLADGTSSVWENDFSSSGNNETGDGLTHQFDTAGDELDPISAGGGQTTVSLFWSDPLGKSSNDYDLFIVDGSGSIVASSTNRQTGSQDPYEQANASDGDSAVVVLHSGSTRFIHVDLDAQNSSFGIATNDRTRGHNAAANAFTVAATPATTGTGGSGAPNGPYPNPFNTSNVIETFSNDGPRHIFYNPDGSAITTSLTHTGGKTLNKPDFTAADGTSSTLPLNGGLNPFFGTSCAAPHAGAIAALVLSYNKTLTRSQLSTILKNSATDIMTSGYDIDAGAGILNALKALQNTPAPTTATALSSLTLSPTSGFGGSTTVTGTVTLTAAATASTTVTLSSSSASLTLPASVTVSTGSKSATFTANSHTVTAVTTITVTASYSGVSKTATFTDNPTSVSSLSFSPTSVTGGSANATGTVHMTGAVGSAQTITLTSSNTSALTVPASVSVPAGSTSVTFTATSHAVTSAATVTVTASYNGGSKTATVTVNPAASSGVKPKTLTLSPNPAYANSLTTGTVTLTAAAPSGGTAVTISSVSGSTKTALVTVTVPAGSTTATFSLRAGYVSATTTYSYSADANGGSATATLTVKPSTVQLTGFTVTPNPASTSGTLTVTVTLSAAAPTGGAAASLRLNGTLLGFVTVPAGSTTKSLMLLPPQVTTSTAETYLAFYNNVSKTVTVTVNP